MIVENCALVKQFMYAAGLGRNLYDINKKDRFQRITTVVGEAGTGKSMLAKVWENVYEFSDVKQASSSQETVFGLSAMYGGVFWILDEMTKNNNISEADILTVSVGGSVQVRIKNKTAISVRWKSPGIMLGNVFGWRNTRDNMARRLILAYFDYKLAPNEIDSDLEIRLVEEVPRIILKINRAYLALLDHMKTNAIRDLAAVAPKYYARCISRYIAENDFMERFLQSKLVEMPTSYAERDTIFCPLQLFIAVFNDWCKENNIHKPPAWGPMLFNGAFSRHNIINTKSIPWIRPGYKDARAVWKMPYPRDQKLDRYETEWVIGVDVAKQFSKRLGPPQDSANGVHASWNKDPIDNLRETKESKTESDWYQEEMIEKLRSKAAPREDKKKDIPSGIDAEDWEELSEAERDDMTEELRAIRKEMGPRRARSETWKEEWLAKKAKALIAKRTALDAQWKKTVHQVSAGMFVLGVSARQSDVFVTELEKYEEGVRRCVDTIEDEEQSRILHEIASEVKERLAIVRDLRSTGANKVKPKKRQRKESTKKSSHKKTRKAN